jgi:hypothetical protein
VPLDRKKSNEKGEVKDSKLPSALTRSMPPPLMTSTVSTTSPYDTHTKCVQKTREKCDKYAKKMRKKCWKKTQLFDAGAVKFSKN